jgi:hypothetical protein
MNLKTDYGFKYHFFLFMLRVLSLTQIQGTVISVSEFQQFIRIIVLFAAIVVVSHME